MRFKVSDQCSTVCRTLIKLTQAVNFQTDVVQTQILPETRAHQNLLGIDIRPGKAECLDAYLMKLTIPTLLGTLVTEHLPRVVQTLGALGGHVVLNDRTHATGRTFRTQRERFAVEQRQRRANVLFVLLVGVTIVQHLYFRSRITYDLT